MGDLCGLVPAQVLGVDLQWGPVPDRRVKPASIIEAFDVLDDRTAGFGVCDKYHAIEPLVLHGAEERLGHGIIPARSRPSHRAGHLVFA